jgi:hypothetical protein
VWEDTYVGPLSVNSKTCSKPRYRNHWRVIKVFNQCILPVMTYACETWPLTVQLVDRLKVAKRSMERSMLSMSLRERARNVEFQWPTTVVDIGRRAASLKWAWAGHVFRRNDGRWSKGLREWRPARSKRQVSRPPARCSDYTKRFAGPFWGRATENRAKRKKIGKEYAQRWAHRRWRRIEEACVWTSTTEGQRWLQSQHHAEFGPFRDTKQIDSFFCLYLIIMCHD